MAVGVFFAAFWLAHLIRALSGRRGDELLLPILQALTGLGLLAMFGLRDPLRDTNTAREFATGVAIGCAAFTAASFVDFERVRSYLSTFATLCSAVLLAAALLLFGSGPADSGTKVNLLGFQPVELIRVFLVFALAAFFVRRWEMLRDLSSTHTSASIRKLAVPRWIDLRPLFVIVIAPIVFFFLQKDLGPALVFACLALGMYGIARARSVALAGAAALIAGVFTLAYQLGIPATVAKRVAIWLDPWDNALRGGDQIAHGLWAMSSGSLGGIGLGAGDGQLVPAGSTDLILPVIGEELGFVGAFAVLFLLAILIWRLLRTAARGAGEYSVLLATAFALSVAIPGIVITCGVLGLLPLTGVVTPFLSFGKSAMICNFFAVGACASVSHYGGPPRVSFAAPMRAATQVLAVIGFAILARIVFIQVWQSDAIALRPSLVRYADGEVRLQYNPRLMLAARRILRGTIYDRNGLALATSQPDLAAPMLDRLASAGVGAGSPCMPAPTRCYPLGGAGFHLLGDFDRQTNWFASNSSFVERDSSVILQGFDDHPHLQQYRLPDGRVEGLISRDYSELLPLVRHKANLSASDAQAVLQRSRDLRLSVDGPFQEMVAAALASRVRAAHTLRGAAVVLDAATGEILALASYPWPTGDQARVSPPRSDDDALLDRARYGLYPPGSTFKLVTAAAALRQDMAARQRQFTCERLRDGRVGSDLGGAGRPVHDDPMDRTPHGRIDLHRAIVVSCNAYFAQLGRAIGADALLSAAAPTKIRVTSPGSSLQKTLAEASFGQGEVVASPLRMAGIAAAIASDGQLRDPNTVLDGNPRATPTPWLGKNAVAFLRDAMRDVVTSGTGRILIGSSVPIAGKTGTAEVNGADSHSWFVGFAPASGAQRRIAFAVLVENAGYGGRVAAPLAGDIVAAARIAGVIR